MAQGRMGWRWQYVRQLRSVAGRMDKYQCDRQVRRHSSLPEAINTWRITRNPKWPNAGRWYWWNLDANYGIRRRGEVDTLSCKAFFNPDNWLCISLRSAPRSLASERQYYPGFVRKELQNKVISEKRKERLTCHGSSTDVVRRDGGMAKWDARIALGGSANGGGKRRVAAVVLSEEGSASKEGLYTAGKYGRVWLQFPQSISLGCWPAAQLIDPNSSISLSASIFSARYI